MNETCQKIRQISKYKAKAKEGFMSREMMGKYKKKKKVKRKKKTRTKSKGGANEMKKKSKKAADELSIKEIKKKKKKKTKEDKNKKNMKKTGECNFEIFAGKFDAESHCENDFRASEDYPSPASQKTQVTPPPPDQENLHNAIEESKSSLPRSTNPKSKFASFIRQ